MNPARGGNRSGGGRRSGRGGGRHYSSRGRSSPPVYREVVRSSPVMAVAQPNDVSPISGSSETARRNSATSSVDGVTEKFNDKLSLNDARCPNPITNGVGNMSPIHSESNAKAVHMLESPDQDEEYQTLSCSLDCQTPPESESQHGKSYSEGTSKEVDSCIYDPNSEVLMNPARGGNRSGGGRRSGRGGGRKFSSRGRSSPLVYREVVRSSPAVAQPNDISPISGSSETPRRNSVTSSVDGVTEKFNDELSINHSRCPNPITNGVGNMSPIHSESNAKAVHMLESPDQDKEYQTLSRSLDCQTPLESESQHGKSYSEGTSKEVDSEKSDSRGNGFSFDICVERNTAIPKLRPSLLVINRETKRCVQGDIKILRPGMILLKGYISLKDQVKLIKTCRDLGRGHGGFYQPGYRDGAKLNLKMMCLGKNWDPETCMYGDKRPADDTKPPPIPVEFQQMVKGAIQECHSYLESQSNIGNVRDILPSMSPNLCIVNFYSETGKLGLHQDKDESRESLRKGLPVVSFSLGDTAEFLYGDQRDIDEANKVKLQSGDVLIFGGKSRHIFHGVSNIISETAPKALLEEANLRPGRLNLTFREY